jgi:hypothetical protein
MVPIAIKTRMGAAKMNSTLGEPFSFRRKLRNRRKIYIIALDPRLVSKTELQ